MSDEKQDWPDRDMAIQDGYGDPEKLKAFFEEMDDDLDALRLTNNDRHAALEAAFLTLLNALDEKMPALRDMIANDLDEKAERLHRLRHILGEDGLAEDEEEEEDHSSLSELAIKVRLKTRV